MGDPRAVYNTFILTKSLDEESNELREKFKDGQILENDDFLENIRGVLDEKKEPLVLLAAIINSGCSVFDVEKSMLASSNRGRKLSNARAVITMCARENGFSLEDIAAHFNRDGSGLSHLCSRFLVRHQNSSDLQKQVKQL